MGISRIRVCYLCSKQTEKSKYGSPHVYLQEIGEQRNFIMGSDGEGHYEQDYQCSTCKAKFTFCSLKINLAWTLCPSDEPES